MTENESQPTPLRDLKPAAPAPRGWCRNCHGSRWQIVIVARVAYWLCSRCHMRPEDLPPAPQLCGAPKRSGAGGLPCRYLLVAPGDRCPHHGVAYV